MKPIDLAKNHLELIKLRTIMWQWVQDNEILSGTGVFLLAGIGYLIRKFLFKEETKNPIQDSPPIESEKSTSQKTKTSFKVLFIDDQTFKVVDILKQQGWSCTKRIKDVRSLDEPDVIEAEVFFVDIQGVGRLMQFKDEGLGLAMALKDKYPSKKVVIYSSENKGDRFHKALKRADDYLSKNADPYEFEQIIKNFFDKQL